LDAWATVLNGKAPSPKYFGFKRGITWLNAVNDQVAGIGQMVVPGAPRDSLHILDVLLNLDGGVRLEIQPRRRLPGHHGTNRRGPTGELATVKYAISPVKRALTGAPIPGG
jgi:TnpA family transposase